MIWLPESTSPTVRASSADRSPTISSRSAPGRRARSRASSSRPRRARSAAAASSRPAASGPPNSTRYSSTPRRATASTSSGSHTGGWPPKAKLHPQTGFHWSSTATWRPQRAGTAARRRSTLIRSSATPSPPMADRWVSAW
ncbi:MAG: hypothetical protein M0Z30_13640 [Actinomycetota bacterium]|nr:hypothetical protein [Actinomycetota bacterium]